MIRAIGCLVLLAAACVPQARAETVAIVHATAWTLTDDAPVEDATLVLADGRIVSVTAGGAVPEGARVIDAGGRPVTPGLMNAATQVGLVEVGSAGETVGHSAKSGVGPGFDVQYAIDPNALVLLQARADGMTRTLAYPGGSAVAPFAGSAALLRLHERGEVVERAGAAVFADIGGRSARNTVGSRAAQWQLLREALDAAREPAGAAAQSADTRALRAVLAGKTPLAIATQRESDLRQAVRLARDYGIRVVVIGGAEAWRLAPELAAAQVPVILDPMANLPSSFDQVGARLDNAALLHRAGVAVAFSLGGIQSYNPGLALREGAGLAVANGLPYVEGLRAIATVPARIWGVEDDRYGTLAPGRDADLVIWDGDPLEPSTSPAAVFVEGREVSLATHQTRLRDRYLPQARRAQP